jgi:hypothetical protein
LNVWLYVSPFSKHPVAGQAGEESNDPSSAVTECGACPLFVQVTMSPSVIVTELGL